MNEKHTVLAHLSSKLCEMYVQSSKLAITNCKKDSGPLSFFFQTELILLALCLYKFMNKVRFLNLEVINAERDTSEEREIKRNPNLARG